MKLLTGLKKIYSFLTNDSLQLKKINSQQIIETFETAEMIYFDLSSQNKNNNFDYSLTLVEYGKGLETYMHDNISYKLRQHIESKHLMPIDDENWINKNKNKSLPPELRNVLGIEKRTISLGQWKPLMSTVFDSNLNKIKNPYTKDSYIFLKDFMNKDDWDTVTEACAIISDYRNGSAHYGKKAFKDIIPMRKEIVEQINNVIDVLHSHNNPDV